MEMELWKAGRVFPLKVDESGRLVIPAATKLRQAIKSGERLVGVELNEGGLQVRTHADVLREIQEYAKRFVNSGDSVVDELLAERRADAARE